MNFAYWNRTANETFTAFANSSRCAWINSMFCCCNKVQQSVNSVIVGISWFFHQTIRTLLLQLTKISFEAWSTCTITTSSTAISSPRTSSSASPLPFDSTGVSRQNGTSIKWNFWKTFTYTRFSKMELLSSGAMIIFYTSFWKWNFDKMELLAEKRGP